MTASTIQPDQTARPEHHFAVMIVGAQKSGTTALDHYLATHPRLCTARDVIEGHSLEITYFLEPARFHRPMPWTYWFGPDPSGFLVGKSPTLMYSAEAIARLHEHNPRTQVVVILRDPLLRAYSAFLHAKLRGLEPLDSFEAAVEAGPTRFPEGDARRFRCAYLEWSRYADFLPPLFEVFGESQVHVVIFEEFIANPRASVASLLSSLGLEPAGLAPSVPATNPARQARSLRLARALRPYGTLARLARKVLPPAARDWARLRLVQLNSAAASPSALDPATEASLRPVFAEQNHRLGDLLGRDVSEFWPDASGG